jgi:hypothetical protein
MALDINSAVGQAENVNSQLAKYFSDLNKYLVDTTGTVKPPDMGVAISSLDYSELLRMTTTRASDLSSYENGAAIENVHLIVAVKREYDLGNKSKINYYSDASTESRLESDMYTTLKTFWVNMMNGIYVDGETS